MDENAETIEAGAVDYTELTADLVSAYVSNNRVPPGEIGALITTMHAALTGLGSAVVNEGLPVEKLSPYQIRKSITHEALISFEDGKPYKTLKRHLTALGLTPQSYREKWGLPRDYPLTAASYSEQRSTLAMSLGLGRPRKTAEPATTIPDTPKRAGRPRKAAEV